MRLHEAIEKAGEGGQIRRKGLIGIVTIGDDCLMENEREVNNFGISNLTANDWMVVEPEPVIEVNDVVTAACDAEECMLIGIHPDGDRCAVKNIKKPWCVCDDYDSETPLSIRNHLSLIRKGPKVHVFKGISFSDMEIKNPNCPENKWATVPQNKAKGRGMKFLCDNGKTYCVILEESQ